MQRLSTGTPANKLTLAAVLFFALTHAAGSNAAIAGEPPATAGASSSLGLVWEELKLGGDKRFNAFIQASPVAREDAGHGAGAAPPVPSPLWILGAGIIGLATVARRRSS